MIKKQLKIADKNGHDSISGALFLSHQLMATLTAMKWSLQMLNQGDFGPISQEQKSIIEKMAQKNDLLISLANRVVHTVKLENEQYCCNQGPVTMENLVNAVLEYCKEAATKKGVILEFKKPATKIPSLTVDEEMIKIALQNLIDNAIKYSPQGGVVQVGLVSDGKNVQLTIQDAGIGVPQKQKNKLFHKFFRADNAIASSATGSGLGLFISQNIIQAHGGKIWFDSIEHEGSTFYFSLPVQAAKETGSVE